MNRDDPRYATFPAELGLDQLHWLIQRTAGGELEPGELIRSFRAIHEALEARGRIKYASREEARLIWDILWALEFYSPDPSREENPREWNDQATVLSEVKRVAAALQRLAAG